jgi:hypothetical protein
MKTKLAMKLGLCLVMVTALVLMLGYPAQADTVKVTVSDDTYVDQALPTFPWVLGAASILTSGTGIHATPAKIQRAYFKFNLSTLPADKIVTSATLNVYYAGDVRHAGGPYYPDYEHKLYVVSDYLVDGTTPWKEGYSGSNPPTDSLTWNLE